MPRKRRVAKSRRADDSPFPELTEVLLRGWDSPSWPTTDDPFRIFDMSPEALREAWRTHRVELMDEWQRRNLADAPWAVLQGFDRCEP